MGTVITNLDNIVTTAIGDQISTHVNIVAANQAITDANAAVITATDKADIATAQAAIATSKAAEADASADAAGASEIAAATSASEAQAERLLALDYRNDAFDYLTATMLKYDEFDDRYLGAYDDDPLTYNDGRALIEGALYWHMIDKSIKVYTGSIWKNIADASGALIAALNLSDLPNKVTARDNLGVYSKTETDTAISDAVDVVDTKVDDLVDTIGQASGIAPLNASGLVDATYLPSYVDDVVEVATKADLPIVGEADKIYVVVTDETSNNDTSTYRWTGTSYAMVSNTLTGADVAALYESVVGVNRYTDAEKTKLAGIEVGATADQLASEVPYDNTISGMLATNVQEAINELVADKADKATTLAGYSIADAYTKTEVDNALALQNQASEISVSPKDNLSSTTVQLALEELQSDVNALNSALGTVGTIEW